MAVKKKAAKKTVKTVADEPPRRTAPARGENTDLEEGVEEIMESIDEHELVIGEVSQATSAQFYEQIASTCRERAALIREEMGEEVDEDDEADVDDVDLEDEDEE